MPDEINELTEEQKELARRLITERKHHTDKITAYMNRLQPLARRILQNEASEEDNELFAELIETYESFRAEYAAFRHERNLEFILNGLPEDYDQLTRNQAEKNAQEFRLAGRELIQEAETKLDPVLYGGIFNTEHNLDVEAEKTLMLEERIESSKMIPFGGPLSTPVVSRNEVALSALAITAPKRIISSSSDWASGLKSASNNSPLGEKTSLSAMPSPIEQIVTPETDSTSARPSVHATPQQETDSEIASKMPFPGTVMNDTTEQYRLGIEPVKPSGPVEVNHSFNSGVAAPPAKLRRSCNNYFTVPQQQYLRELKEQTEFSYPKIAERINERFGSELDARQCQQKWERVLKPNLSKGRWSRAEDDKLRLLLAQTQGNIQKVSKLMPERHLIQIKDRIKILERIASRLK